MRTLPGRAASPAETEGTMKTSVSAVISQCTTEDSRYCRVLPLNPSSGGTSCRKRGEIPIFSGLPTGAPGARRFRAPAHPQLALPARDVVQRAALAKRLAQPSRIAAGVFLGERLYGRRRARAHGVPRDPPGGLENVVAQTRLPLAGGVDDAPLDAVAAGLEAIVVVDQVDLARGRLRTLLEQPAR